MFLILGILFEHFLFSSHLLIYPLIFSLAVFIIFRKRVIAPYFAFASIFLFGALYAYLDHQKLSNELPQSFSKGKVITSPQALTNWHRFTVRLDAAKQEHSWIPENQQCLIYLYDSLACPAYGDEVVLAIPIDSITPPKNPGEFNFQKYWEMKHIAGQIFIKSEDDLKVISSSPFALEAVRKYIKETVASQIKDPNVAGLIGTLFTGDKTLLDYDTKKSFSATGSVHILAVSGLHLGVIFMFATFLFAPLKAHTKGRYIFLLLVLSIIWFYALITGLSPSIFRAAIMFSVFTLAGTFWLRSTTLNNTFLAAFIITLIDVRAIFDPGFLFSFSAVLGIVLLYRPLYASITFKNKILDYCWLMSCISIAAQLTTFPLVVFYFHQFPVYFLISNLLLIPLAAALLYGGVVWLLFSAIPGISIVLAWCINFTGKLMIEIVFFIQSLPGSLITGIRLSFLEMILLYLIIGLLCFAFLNRKAFPIKVAFYISLLFLGLKSMNFYKEFNQQKMVVYHLPYHTGIDLISGKSTTLIHDDWHKRSKKNIDFTIDPSHLFHGIVHQNERPIDSLKTWRGLKTFKMRDKSVGILENELELDKYTHVKRKIVLDLLVVRNNIHPSYVSRYFEAKEVIVDGSNYIGNHPDYTYTHAGAYQTNY